MALRALVVCLLAVLAAAPAAAVERVAVGVYVNDIQNLELKSHSYAVDVYVWFRWRDARIDPAATLEFMNPYELWGHSRSNSYERSVRLKTGELYQVVRVQGRFSRKLPLNDYPFDRQTLTVEFEDAGREAEDLVFVADANPVGLNPELQLPGFKIGAPSLTVFESRYASDFGDPRRPDGTLYSRVRLAIPITRPAASYCVKLLLPILCVIFCAALMFLFHPKYVDARVGLGITSLLTIVALQITLNDALPEVDYLVLMHKLYLGAYLFVIAGLAVVVKTTWMHGQDHDAEALRLEHRGLAFLLTLYLVAMGVLILPHLWS